MGRWYQNGNRPQNGGGKPAYNTARPVNNQGGGNKGDYHKNNGARKGEKNGKRYISAWNNSRDKGFVSVLIAPYHGTKDVNSENAVYTVLMAKIHYHRSGVQRHYPVLLSHKTGKCVLKEDGFSVNAEQNYMVRMKKK